MIRLASIPAHRGAPAYSTAGLDGVEAICGPDNRANAPPGTVGLRMNLPMCWREAWLGLPEAAQWHERIPTRDELVEHMAAGIDEARRLRVKYVAIPASHGTPEGVLSARHAYTDFDVLSALGEWVYLAMGEQDHGFEVLFENTWHAGLRWTEPRHGEMLLEKVRHPRAGFAFDFGHYLLTVPGGAQTESADLRRMKNWFKSLPRLGPKIRSFIFHRPGQAPVASDLVKKVRESKDPEEKMRIAQGFDAAVDAHRPWVSASLKELVDEVRPAYVVHRLGGTGPTWDEAIKKQDALLR